MELQLYMWTGIRDDVLRRHAFYVEQVRSKILVQFRDFESEAERFGEAEFNRLSAEAACEADEGELAEAAQQRSEEFYELMSDLGQQTRLAAVAGMYHQWEKDLRHFIERELAHYFRLNDAVKMAWRQNIADVFSILKQFGWDCSLEGFYAQLDACRLIVNVYKHGKGQSLNDLTARYPVYMQAHRLPEEWKVLDTDDLDHEWLSLDERQFLEIASAIEAFWRKFPERLFFQVVP